MNVIPVIDIKNGQVVHARGGRRDDYRPIETPLSATSDPADIARGLLALHPFRVLYIADLDAIEGRPANDAAIAGVAAAAPELGLWIDNGIGAPEAARAWLALNSHTLVLGSESQRDDRILSDFPSCSGNGERMGETHRSDASREHNVVLSLDYRGDAFLGPPGIEQDPSRWPDRVIVMTLARVGAARGPDFERIGSIVKRSAGRLVHAAGGVRNLSDLQELRAIGVAGALIATALHNGELSAKDLNQIARP